jgi:hypothetical protein
MLHLFAGASGLVTNIDKCVVSPIRCTDEQIAKVQEVFPCVPAPFPCKYLGIPLSLRRLRRYEEQALVDKVAARIPTWKSGLLNHAGRTLLTKVTLSAIPVHISIDRWATMAPLCRFAPDLFAAVSRAGKRRSVKDGLMLNRWTRDVEVALTAQVLCQFLRVWHLMQNVVLNPLQADRFVWRWSPDGKYSASSTYCAFFNGSTSLLGAKELWRAKVPPKVKFFFWLALHRRLWTAERRKRHGLQENDDCALCGQAPESGDHLFLGCVFTRELWFKLLAPVGLAALVLSSEERLDSWWMQQRRRLDRQSRPVLDGLLLLLCWCIWKERNRRTFDPQSSNVDAVAHVVLLEAEDWVEAGFSYISVFTPRWSQHMVNL